MGSAEPIKKPRRLLVVSSGSMQTSVVARNAIGRLKTISEAGAFSRIEYVFFRTSANATHRVDDVLTVHDVAGEPPLATGLRKLLSYETGLRRIAAIAGDLLPEVVSVIDPFQSSVIGRLIARKHKAAFVVTLVSAYKLSYDIAGVRPMGSVSPRIAFSLERRSLAAADMILTDCDFYGRYAVSRGARPERVRVMPRYAEDVSYSTPKSFDWAHHEVAGTPITYVGRLAREKYADDLCSAWERVAISFPDQSFVVLGGGGDSERQFIDRAEAGSLRGRVRIIRGLSGPDVHAAIGSSRLVTVTHGGYALLEAALAGAPIVAYNFEWHPEVITDGETGILVPYRDSNALASGVLRLLGDPALASALGARAGEKTRERFNRHAALDALKRYYSGVYRG